MGRRRSKRVIRLPADAVTKSSLCQSVVAGCFGSPLCFGACREEAETFPLQRRGDTLEDKGRKGLSEARSSLYASVSPRFIFLSLKVRIISRGSYMISY